MSKRICKPSLAEVEEYYLKLNHSIKESSQYFKMGQTSFVNLLKEYNIKKSMEKRQELIENTCIKKYGYKNPMQVDIIKQKSVKTCLEKYGVPYAVQDSGVLAKIENSNINKYGAANPFASEIIKQKIKKTNNLKYGTDNPIQKNISKSLFSIWKDKNEFKDFILENYNLEELLVEDLCKLFNVSYTAMSYKLKEVGLYDKISSVYISQYEKEIFNYINSIINTKIVRNSRKVLPGYELDLYLPEYNFAIEFNGDYWHCSKRKNKYYHQKKSLAALKRGIYIFHIFEHQWVNNKEDIKNNIKKYLLKQEYKKDIFVEKIKIIDLNRDNPLIYLENGYAINRVLEPGHVIYNTILKQVVSQEYGNSCNYYIYDCGKIELVKGR